MAIAHHLPPFLNARLWRELLAHRLALSDRENNLLKYLHKFMSQNEHAMAPQIPLKAHLWDHIETELLISQNQALFADNGGQFGCVGKGEEGLSSEQVVKAITVLAQFHAFSLAVPGLCGPETVLPHLSHPNPENELVVKKWLLDMLLSLPGCDYFRKNERSLRNFLQNVGFSVDEEKMSAYMEKDLPIVLCHGNFCAENILFDNFTHEQGRPTDAGDNSPMILCWELAYPGFGICDVAHLLLSSVNSSLRIHSFDQWVELYVHKFEHFRLLQRNLKKGKMSKISANKNKMGRIVKKHKQQLHASLASQLLRVLPKLATDYRKLVDQQQANLEEEDKYCQGKRCVLLGRMIGGFEMIRKDFEQNK